MSHFILYVADPQRSVRFCASVLGAAPRDRGDSAAVSLDPDGHVLAFAASPRA